MSLWRVILKRDTPHGQPQPRGRFVPYHVSPMGHITEVWRDAENQEAAVASALADYPEAKIKSVHRGLSPEQIAAADAIRDEKVHGVVMKFIHQDRRPAEEGVTARGRAVP